MKKSIISIGILIISLLNTTLYSQSKLSVSYGIGGIYYMGDLKGSSLPDTKTLNIMQKAEIEVLVINPILFNLTYIHGQVEGADSIGGNVNTKSRNLHFQSNINELDLGIRLNLLNFKGKGRFTPYIHSGIGVFHFNPRAQDDGKWVSLQPLGTEGQNLGKADALKPYSLTQMQIPIGMGTEFKITSSFSLKTEFTYHKLNTDYLDDVSLRGNNKNNDSYFNFDISAKYTFKQKSGKFGRYSNNLAEYHKKYDKQIADACKFTFK